MQHLKEFQEAFEYVTQLPVNDEASVHVSHNEYGARIEIHRANEPLVEQIIRDKGQVRSSRVLPETGNVVLRWPKVEVFVSPNTFAELLDAEAFDR